MESYVIALAVSSALVSLFAAIWGVRANMIQQNSIRYTTRNLTRNLTRGLTRISFPVAVEEILLKQISLLQRQLGSSELQIWLNEEKWEYFVKRITNTNWEETKNFPLEEFLEKFSQFYLYKYQLKNERDRSQFVEKLAEYFKEYCKEYLRKYPEI